MLILCNFVSGRRVDELYVSRSRWGVELHVNSSRWGDGLYVTLLADEGVMNCRLAEGDVG